MPNILLAIYTWGWENCGKVCAKMNKFCAQLSEKSGILQRITFQFSIPPDNYPIGYVGKTSVKALMLSTITHNQSPPFLSHLTEMLSSLSTLSTPPITTTTKNIY
jgi:hypothetical protein